MDGLPLLPAIFLDILGSAANIAFSFLAWRYARLLTRRQPGNFVWGYLYYVTFAIAAFAISPAIFSWIGLANEHKKHIPKHSIPSSSNISTAGAISCS